MKLIFASNNKNKLAEIQRLVSNKIEIISLKDAGIFEELPEPFDTFRENAHSKADYIFQKTGLACFAEDSGLIVNALNGAPGVYSARYSGEQATDVSNNEKLLSELSGIDNRAAYYQCTICLLLPNETRYFEGQCHGKIAENSSGNGGFGYDPLFIPDGYNETFGALPSETKSAISHRAKAVQQFVAHINTLL